jgi:glycosyltransferase involved in cell wall biosynthesis
MRIAIFSRYNLADQVLLAPELKPMLALLSRTADILFMSMRGKGPDDLAGIHIEIEAMRLQYDRASARDIQLKTVALYARLPGIAKRLRAFRPRLIFLVDNMPLFGWLLKRLSRAPVATMYGDWSFHNMFERKRWARPFLKALEAVDRYEMRRLDGFFCRAASAKERLVSWGIRPDLVRVVRDAPDPAVFFPQDQRALRQRCGFTDQDIVLSFHGVMHQGKGLDHLIGWANDLHREDSRIGLLLIGTGPEEGNLRRLAEGLPLGRKCFFTGWLASLREVGMYCNAGDICIAMRTASEANQGIVPGALLHGMACRQVAVAPRLRGTSEIVEHGRNGYLFEAGNGEDFKKVIRSLAANRGAWEAVAGQAFEDIQRDYSVEAAARKYAEALSHFAAVRK